MDNLITFYQQRLNLPNATFLRIDHDDAMVAIVYKVTTDVHLQFILKICTRPKDYAREVYFLTFFSGKLPVPRIIQIVPPEPGINGAILIECLPGNLIKIADFTVSLAFEMGSLLARIHLNRVAGYGDLTEPNELSPDPHIYFTSKYEEGFDECNHHLPQALINQCRSYYNAHLHLLSSVDGPCIIHRDYRAGNVIVHEGKIQGIIDWSSGRASFAEEDFCPIEHSEWPSHPKSKNSFLAGYASIRPVPDYNALMPLLRLVKALATIGFMVKRGTWKSGNERLYQFNRHFLETFFQKTGL